MFRQRLRLRFWLVSVAGEVLKTWKFLVFIAPASFLLRVGETAGGGYNLVFKPQTSPAWPLSFLKGSQHRWAQVASGVMGGHGEQQPWLPSLSFSWYKKEGVLVAYSLYVAASHCWHNLLWKFTLMKYMPSISIHPLERSARRLVSCDAYNAGEQLPRSELLCQHYRGFPSVPQREPQLFPITSTLDAGPWGS